MVGDKIRDERGRVGTVTRVVKDPKNVLEYLTFTVKWQSGALGINYTHAERFTLISRDTAKNVS